MRQASSPAQSESRFRVRQLARAVAGRSILAIISLSLLTLLPAIGLGRGGQKSQTAAPAYPVPFISEISPVSRAPGGGDFTLTVRGTGFINWESVIYWNGQALPDPTTCTPASPPQLAACTATVRAEEISTAGTADITVVNPDTAPLNGTSNVVFFPVADPVEYVFFAGGALLTTPSFPSLVAAGDFNGDGKLDLAVANDCTEYSGGIWACGGSAGTLTTVLGNGDGTFTETSTLPATWFPFPVVSGDFNGDGRLDFVYSVDFNYTPGAPTLCVLLQPGPPTADSVTPNAASGPSQTFALEYSDSPSFNALWWVFARFGPEENGCEVEYNWILNTLSLLNDAGTAFQGALTPGTSGTLSNSQCTVNGAGTSVSGSNQTLTLNLSVSAAASFTGSKQVYMGVVDSEGSKSGWVDRGTWMP
jgi:hypothetical protein